MHDNGNDNGRMKSSLCLGHDAVERPGKKVDARDDMAQALDAAGKLHNEHDGTRVKRILQLLQRVVPETGMRVRQN
jgi:hypothetical protein